MFDYQLALIGDPIAHSKSDRYHNYFLSSMHHAARYGKVEINACTLENYLRQAKQSAMLGLSVTMPLKESIIPLLDHIDATALRIGAVNTVKLIDGKALGYNTDIAGAIQSIQHIYHQPLAGKKALIIGAGGVAKAVACGLIDAGVHTTITNRTYEKAVDLAKILDAKACTMDQLKAILQSDCDILIQATSVGMQNNSTIVNPDYIPAHVIVLDVVSAPQNGWLDTLAHKGCTTISGKLFWIFQAIEQYKIWFDDTLDLSSAFSLLQQAINDEG